MTTVPRGLDRAASALDELDEDAAGASGVDEGDEAAVRAFARFAIDQFDARRLQLAKGGGEVGDSVGQVMQSGTAALEEARDRRVGREWLDEFQTALAGAQEDDVDTLGFDPLTRGCLALRQQTQRGKGLIDRGDRDRYMIEW